MTTIQILLAAIPVLISFLPQIFRKYLDGVFPDNVKFAKGINKILSFTLSYLLPISSIVWYMIKASVVDKWFVFDIAILMAVLVNNFLLMIINIHADIARIRIDSLKDGMDRHQQSIIFLMEKV